jgi:regulator of sirC expression with transglutaminase-like and TPR domain
MNRQRLNILFQLLDDPNETVFHHVEKELLKESAQIVYELEKKWETIEDDICQARIEGLIDKLIFKDHCSKLKKWRQQPGPDLLEGFILASRYYHPDMNVEKVYRKIEELRKKVWVELNNSLTSIEKVTVLNHLFFDIYNFQITSGDQVSPRDSFISYVLDTGYGNVFSIAMLYNIIAQKVGLPVQFIDLPKSPLLAYLDRDIASKIHPPDIRTDVLFYINPVNRGSISGRRELEFYLRKMKPDSDEINLEPSSPHCFLSRLLEMTEKSFAKSGQSEKTSEILQMILLLNPKR